jgi:hypothetical protein
MALGAQLARAAEVDGRNARRAERFGARDQHVVGDDVAVLEGKHVERAQELFTFQDERHGQVPAAPAGGERQAGGQVIEDEALDERQRVDDPRRGRGGLQAIHHDRVQARSEDALQIGREPIERDALLRGQQSRFHGVHYPLRALQPARQPRQSEHGIMAGSWS